jgi:hypothetical protein
MLFKPIYDLQHLKYLNKKNLSYHQNLDYLFNISDVIKDSLRWDYVSMNVNALDILYANTDKIDYATLCFNKNPRAIKLIEANIDKVYWKFLSCNPKAINILLNNLDKIDWSNFSSNSASEAVTMLLLNINKIDWAEFSLNSNIKAINYLKEHPDKINWKMLCCNENPEIVSIIKENMEELDISCWNRLKENYGINDFLVIQKRENWSLISQHSKDIEYIRANLDKVDWSQLSANPNMLPIIIDNPHNIDYYMLSSNENPLATDIIKKRISENKFNEFWDFMAGSDTKIDIIFPLCYLEMRDNMTEFNQELCKYVFNPIRLKRMSTTYGIELEDWQEIY